MRREREGKGDFGRIEEILRHEAVWAEPPGEVEPQLLAAITADAPATPAAPAARRMKRRWWPAYVTAAVAAMAALVLILAPFGNEPAPTATFALAGSGDGAGAEAAASVGPAEAGWWIRLEVEGLGPAPQGSYYEGWLSNGVDLVSVGTFHMRDGHSVVLWSGVAMKDFPELSVTLQPVSPDLARTADVVLVGRLDP